MNKLQITAVIMILPVVAAVLLVAGIQHIGDNAGEEPGETSPIAANHTNLLQPPNHSEPPAENRSNVTSRNSSVSPVRTISTAGEDTGIFIT